MGALNPGVVKAQNFTFVMLLSCKSYLMNTAILELKSPSDTHRLVLVLFSFEVNIIY